MTDDELMLALHDMMERVEKEGRCNAAAAQERMAELLELVAEERGVGRLEPERSCEHGCNGCDECTDYDDYADEDRDPPKFGCCLPPGECCMPGLHFPSECHTAADYEREQFGGWASDAGSLKTPNARAVAQPTAPQE